MNRPEYIRCALMDTWEGDPPRPTFRTWCGRITGYVEWTFTTANHALLEGNRGGRLLLCKECASKIKSALDSVVEGEYE